MDQNTSRTELDVYSDLVESGVMPETYLGGCLACLGQATPAEIDRCGPLLNWLAAPEHLWALSEEAGILLRYLWHPHPEEAAHQLERAWELVSAIATVDARADRAGLWRPIVDELIDACNNAPPHATEIAREWEHWVPPARPWMRGREPHPGVKPEVEPVSPLVRAWRAFVGAEKKREAGE